MKPKRVILLDLDGTLIDEEYQLSTGEEQFRNIIMELQLDGSTLIGINSDTPLLPLQSWACRLGMNGPIIGEKGQVLAILPEATPQILGTMEEFFRRLRQQVVIQVHEEFPRTFVAIGDATEFIRRQGHIYGEDQHAVLINGYRQCSFSGFAVTRQDSRVVKDPEIFDRFTKLVLSAVKQDSEMIEVDANPVYGIMILHEKGASKTLAFERLIEHMGADIEYIMIGDGESDIIKTSYPVKICAVGNAHHALKDWVQEAGGIVAKDSFTRGVVEILMHLT